MSICNPCVKLKQISKCTDTIVIGVVSEAHADYTVYFKNTATGKIISFAGSSDVDQLLSITPDDGFRFQSNQDYEVWITIDGDPIEDRQEVQIDEWTVYDDPTTCFVVSFIMIFDGDHIYNFNFGSQIFQLA